MGKIEANSNQNMVVNEPSRRKCKLTKTFILIVIICMTGSFFFVELIVGHVTKSNALIADAFHMLSDLIALIIGLTAVRFSKRQSSRKNTFGWARAEILGSLVNSVFLLALCLTIVIEAVNRYVQPEPLEKIDLMLAVGGGGLALNIISLTLFGLQSCCENSNTSDDTGDGKTHKKKENLNMRAVFLNALGDSLGSVAVVISGLLVKFVPPTDDTTVTWKLYVDPTLSLIISAIIISTVIPLFKKSSFVLMQTVPDQVKYENIKKEISGIDGVSSVHHFHVWSLNTEKQVASAHVRVRNNTDETNDWRTVNAVKKILHKNNIHSTTIQLEHDETASIDSCDSCDENEAKCCNDHNNMKKNFEKYAFDNTNVYINDNHPDYNIEIKF